jgi:hypothetical protein
MSRLDAAILTDSRLILALTITVKGVIDEEAYAHLAFVYLSIMTPLSW